MICRTKHLRSFTSTSRPLTNTDAAELLTIAKTCPHQSGHAVYLARSLYKAVDPLWTFTDDCPSKQAIMRGAENPESLDINAQKAASLNTLQVWPNPTQGSIQLQISTPKAHSIQILDHFGMVKWKASIKTSSWHTVIHADDWPAGLYTIHLFDEDGVQLNSKKLVIIP